LGLLGSREELSEEGVSYNTSEGLSALFFIFSSIDSLYMKSSVFVEGGITLEGSKPAGTNGSSILNSGGSFSLGGSSVIMMFVLAFFVLLPELIF
jgi:hypothetical protein